MTSKTYEDQVKETHPKSKYDLHPWPELDRGTLFATGYDKKSDSYIDPEAFPIFKKPTQPVKYGRAPQKHIEKIKSIDAAGTLQRDINREERKGPQLPPQPTIIGYTQQWDPVAKKYIQEPQYQVIAEADANRYKQVGGSIQTGGGYNRNEIANLQKGGGIHIDPSKKGTFTAQASKMGMGIQEAASKILNATEGRYTPAMRKKANFAKNFAKQEGGEPEDYQQFLDYNATAPENRQPQADWEYGNPRQYDHYGMWDALGKPKDFDTAKEMNPDWQPDPYDGMYHGYSANPNTGVWLKPHIPGEKEEGSTAWMGFMATQLDPYLAKNYNTVYDPELQRMKGVRKQDGGGVKYNTPEYNKAYGEGTVTRYDPETDTYTGQTLPEFTVTEDKRDFMGEMDQIGHTFMNFLGEATPVNSITRIVDDPVGTAKGAGQTLADLTMYSNPGSAMYANMSDNNPITGQP